jgi:2-methylfumaryl-CoA isomerase
VSAVLKGMRVVEGSAFVAVPLAGMTLAQMGADVIRFDRLEGGLDAGRWPVTADGASLFWAGLNKGKRSIAIDMRAPRGRELVSEIITAPGPDAGLFLTNLRVRGWMDYETLSQRREDLVMVALLGDRHGRPAVDYTINPAVGFPMATGPEGSADPVAHVLPAWDCIAGNMAVTALLAAERHRLRHGTGQSVELTLKDVAAAMLGNLGIIGETVINGVDRAKAGNALYGAYGQDFVCADGRRVMVIGLTDRQWRGLLKVTGTHEAMAAIEAERGTDLGDEGNRWLHRAAITQVLAPWFAKRHVEDFCGGVRRCGADLVRVSQLRRGRARGPRFFDGQPDVRRCRTARYRAVSNPGKPTRVFGFRTRAAGGRRAPVLGEHSEEILADVVGLGSGQIGKLMDDGVVATAKLDA